MLPFKEMNQVFLAANPDIRRKEKLSGLRPK